MNEYCRTGRGNWVRAKVEQSTSEAVESKNNGIARELICSGDWTPALNAAENWVAADGDLTSNSYGWHSKYSDTMALA